MITILDYGLGNIRAFENVYRRLNLPVSVANTPGELMKAEKIILPGVGAFDWAMDCLNNSGLRDILDDMVLNKHIPILGVCVGMQMMANSSEEGVLPGLGWLDASVKRLVNVDIFPQIILPHMGWNDVIPSFEHPLFSGMNTPSFYFLHSYFISPVYPSQILAKTQYGSEFTTAVSSSNIYGVQFHPEKSHAYGIQLLKNFALL